MPDLTGPTTSVNSATSAADPSSVNSTGTFTLNLSGTAAGGEPLTYFEVYVGINLGGPGNTLVMDVPAGFPDANGTYHATITYQGVTTGASNSYTFSSLGVDGASKRQATAVDPVTFMDETFAQPSSLAVTGITVEDGAAERSYIRYLGINFNSTTSDSQLTALAGSLETSIKLIKYSLTDVEITPQPSGLLSGVTATVVDHAIELDFGASGIGGTPNTTAADGYYELDVMIGTTTYKDYFYRLLGDVNGDGMVDSNDLTDIATEMTLSKQAGMAPLSADVNGDGTVTALDQTLATRAKGHKLGSGLPLG